MKASRRFVKDAGRINAAILNITRNPLRRMWDVVKCKGACLLGVIAGLTTSTLALIEHERWVQDLVFALPMRQISV